MGEHSKEAVTWGARMARDDNDRMVGYQAYGARRGELIGKLGYEVIFVGDVRDTYREAAQDARAASDAKKG